MLPIGLLALSIGELGAVVVLGVLALGGGVALLVDGLRHVRFRRRAAAAFERVDATVVDAAVHEPATGGSKAVPHVEYEYAVDGTTYTSRSIWPTRADSPDRVDRRVARRIVEDYPTGAEVIARYDPADPATAYLVEQGDATGERIQLALGVALLAAFVALVVFATSVV